MYAVRPTAPAASLGHWLLAGDKTRAGLLADCLARIHDLDGTLHAWVRVEPQSCGAGPLAGIPYGAKDIIDTRALPTEWGSPLYLGRQASEDAAIVRELGQRGALLLGKTQTTAFAYRTPAPTGNPHGIDHTPGGSSSGSAAAVAAGMVPLALGTQTQGSVIRPASFCGIAGFKPTYGLVPMDGILPFAPSLDTLGFFTATAADMLAFWDALGRADHEAARADPAPRALGVPDAPTDAEPAMAHAFEHAVAVFKARGFRVVPIDLREMLAALAGASRIVMAYEAAHVHERRYREHGERMADMATLVREGHEVSAARYEDARDAIEAWRRRASGLFEQTPVILTPAAPGPAPAGLTSTGDPRMNAPWTALGVPAVTVPMGADRGLPLGLQMIAAYGQDTALLRAAVVLAAALNS